MCQDNDFWNEAYFPSYLPKSHFPFLPNSTFLGVKQHSTKNAHFPNSLAAQGRGQEIPFWLLRCKSSPRVGLPGKPFERDRLSCYVPSGFCPSHSSCLEYRGEPRGTAEGTGTKKEAHILKNNGKRWVHDFLMEGLKPAIIISCLPEDFLIQETKIAPHSDLNHY